MTTRTILVVDDERNIRRSLEMILSGEGYDVICAEDGQKALDIVAGQGIEAVLLDIVMSGLSGIEVLKQLRLLRPELAVIMISGHGTVQDAVQATRLGAYDFLEKPLSREKVLLTLSHALESVVLAEENRSLREQIEGRFDMVGESRAILAIREQIAMVAPTNGRVLILGESGTGKELVARDVHRNSRRAEGPFIKVNCAAIPEELIESELFGSDRGAFTGAVKTRDGKFLMADRGTLFLDEIGDMSLSVQAKVLRALEQGEFERVGGSETIKVDVRVIAATNKDLKGLVEKGEFREDLFFRLNVVPIVAPPLRSRRDDVPLLANHFLRTYAAENDFKPKQLTDPATEALCAYDWPGNIRELKNIVERLSIMVRQDVIDVDDLPSMSGPHTSQQAASDASLTIPGLRQGQTLREVRDAVERACISQALKHSDWNVTKAARALGIERTNLHKKMNYYEIQR
jgi:two-component system, NtrC family, nitrogen regulation response regulator NtrX